MIPRPRLGPPAPPLRRGARGRRGGGAPGALDARLKEWGFNTLGADSLTLTGWSRSTRMLDVTIYAEMAGCRMLPKGRFADVFDPKFAATADERAKLLAPDAQDKHVIGAFPDNEINWLALDNTMPTLTDGFIALPPEAAGKQDWVNNFLKPRYATVAALNTAWGTTFAAWTGAGNSVINIRQVVNRTANPAVWTDKLDYLERIAGQYYMVVADAMRRHDPNHLVFSDRYRMEFFYDPVLLDIWERVWRAAGRHCDAIAQNGYWDLAALEQQYKFFSRQFGASGRPVMITEHNTMANDGDHYNQYWLPTQADRVEQYRRHLDQVAALGVASDPKDGTAAKIVLGTHWFAFYDEPPLGNLSGENWPSGLASGQDDAWMALVEPMADLHRTMKQRLAGSAVAFLAAPKPLWPAADGPAPARASSDERIWDAQSPDLRHYTGALVNDAAAGRGKAWNDPRRSGGQFKYMQTGPYLPAATLRPGAATLRFRLRSDAKGTEGKIGILSVSSGLGATTHATHELMAADLAGSTAYKEIELNLTIPSPVPEGWEFRIQTNGKAALWLDVTRMTVAAQTAALVGLAASDGDATTTWRSASFTDAAHAEWVAFDLGRAEAQPRALTLRPAPEGGWPVDYVIERSNDFSAWTTVKSFTAQTAPAGELRIELPGDAARWLRLRATKLGRDAWGRHALQVADAAVEQAVAEPRAALEWTAVPGAASYTLLLSPDAAFPERTTLRVEKIAGTKFTPADALAQGRWHWTVRAIDPAGRGGPYAGAATFLRKATAGTAALAGSNLNNPENWQIAATGAGEALLLEGPAISGKRTLRLVFTPRSYDKLARKSATPAALTARWAGPPLTLADAAALRVRMQPEGYGLKDGRRVSPAPYIKLRMLNDAGEVVSDGMIDPAGTTAPGTWSELAVPLTAKPRARVTTVELSAQPAGSIVLADQRIVMNLEFIAVPTLAEQQSAADAAGWTAYE